MEFNCNICNKEFKSALALAGHKRMHGPSNGSVIPYFRSKCCVIETKEEITVEFLETYLSKICSCKNCGKKIYNQDFCCKSCSTTFTNKQRKPRSAESRKKTSRSLGIFNSKKPKKEKPEKIIKPKKLSKTTIITKEPKIAKDRLNKKLIVGEYSYAHLRTCRHCSKKFYSRTEIQYCKDHAGLYMAENRNRFKFTFNVFHHPELFDLNLLKEIGWYSPGGKAGKWNINGLSRDHKVSVNDAIKNNYDPFYIKHPLNCELITHAENNKKKTKSSISYERLILLVEEYEENKRKKSL